MEPRATKIPWRPAGRLLASLAGVVWLSTASTRGAAPLTALDYRLTGSQLTITPSALAVPKNIGGSVATALTGAAPTGSYVEAFLRGPSFPARRLVGAPGQPLLLPPLNLVGDYSLDGIRLTDGTTNATLLEGTPSSVPVHVFDEVLISRVTSRPLTLEEIQGRGIVIDEQNFRAIEFEVGFVLDGKTIPVRFPVVAPAFAASTEIIPTAELNERLRQTEEINDQLSQGVVLPPELESANVGMQVKGLNFQFVDPGDGDALALKVPPIPALMVIPGNIGFLNQFFSVMIFTENGAPAGSGLSATNIAAELVLPTGPDRIAGTFAQPGDDPLRFARVGQAAVIEPVQPVRQLGSDGKLGTADDIARLQPGETGQGEFLVEGLQEGLHIMDLKLTADLEGLAAGVVKIEGRAAGSVLVRNPKFSFAFAHPRTVRAGEPYEAFVTILNTSLVPANLVSVTLNSLSISGGVLESDETVELGTISPGQTATAKFRICSQRTGAITFSNITTSDDSLVGRFRLHGGVDERGVPLSPDTLVLPNFVDELPADLLAAANRVLGQALSVAKAGQPPAGVLPVSTGFLKQKAIELAEAGQRVRYGEPLARVVPELLLDWQGARDFSPGWDQILRETNAGIEWREALMRAIEDATPGIANARLLGAARQFAGRGETWFLGAVSAGDFQADPPSANELNLVKSATERATLGKSSLAKAVGYPGRAGAWMAGAEAGVFEWKFATPLTAPFQASVVLVRADGTAAELLWRLDSIAAGACLRFDAAAGAELIEIDDDCDGTADRTLAAQRTDFSELPPAVLLVRQEPEILVGRPTKPCPTPGTTNDTGESIPINNYANVLAVLFSKPMTQSLANVPEAYTLEGGNQAAFVQMQPGGRIALITMREPVGKLVPRQMSVAPTVKDARGNALATIPVPVQSRLVEGIIVRGRVIRADGSFSAGVPVTLTYYDEVDGGLSGCLPFVMRPAQVFTDADGGFQFDFVLAGIPYSVSATDTSGLSPDLITAILESTHGDSLDRARLLELANSPSVQNTLLAEFAVGALPQAIAKAEGLDRALVRDSVPIGSPREGTTSVYALRFRGRGSVIGQVLAADGVTPVPEAAVNLFPDPASRELGRGLLSDVDGRFAFFGVPLGTFSIEATSPTGPARVVSDTISAAGETRTISVVLSASAPPLGELQGRVTEPDGTPHAGASVFVGRFDPNTGQFGSVVAVATADVEGFWHATNVTAGVHDVVALSADGKRKGERREILTAADAVNTVNVTLQARAAVIGRVETSTGIPVPNALVGGGEALVRTDASGRFVLEGVPTGQRAIVAALERNPAAGIDFPRTGSGSVSVLPGAENFVIVRLGAAGRIIGRVLDETGTPVPGMAVAIPQLGGFLWANADAQGNFEFAGLGLAKYDLSAPAPPHEEPFDGEAAARSLLASTTDEMLATIGEAFAAFTGVNNPLLNGEGAGFNPSKWGFREDVELSFDGQTVVADVQMLGAGTIAGVVKNGQGVPIGARVRLTGIGPAGNGAPTMVIRGERDSDPALGTFEFPNQALIGVWGLQASSPFFPVVISSPPDRTTPLAPNDTDNVLQFPSVRETNGSLAGIVLGPDGSPAGANVKVQISFGPDFIIRTGADGRFATQAGTFTLPAIDSEGRPGVGYTVTATDESNGATGQATITVMPAQVNSVTVRLLGRGAAVVTVVRADGTPAAGAALEIQGGVFPRERLEGTTDAAGHVTFQNLFEGPYGACAILGTGLARIAGRVNFNVITGAAAGAILRLGGTGTVRGTFFARNGVTPVAFANVALGSLAFNSTDADGRFEFPDVPIGRYRLTATDAVTGRSGSATAVLASTNETIVVNLVETALGEVFGRVVNALGNGNVATAEVQLRHSDPFVPQRTVTTGPDGSFRFPGTPAGGLTLVARDPVTGGQGTASGTLPETAATFEMNVALASVAHLTVTVFEPDGTTPATLATVRVPVGNATVSVDTNAQGKARFDALPLAAYHVTAESRALGFTRRWAGAVVSLGSQGAEETLTLTLRGVGAVTGTVFQGDGATPSPGAQVTLIIGSEAITVPGGVMNKPSAGQTADAIADPQGRFLFTNIPLGEVRLTATTQALGASENASVLSDGQTVTRNLTLTASATVTGRVVRPDATTPAPGTDLLLTFTSQSGLPGRVTTRTSADGRFSVGLVPVGPFHAEFTNADVGGIALRDATATTNGEVVNLGDVVLDEAFPAVVQVTPPDTATGVSTTITVELLFSEALANSSLDPTGVFIRRTDTGALVPATLTLTAPAGEAGFRLVRLAPLTPLASEKTFQVVVVSGELVNATGVVTNRGPRDLVGRPLAALFNASFTTRDGTPPTLLSFTPENGAERVVRTPVRLSFDEPIQPGAVVTLTGPGGQVAGTTSLGVNSLVLTFVPAFDLPPNGTFTINVDGVKDLAGNDLVGQPRTATFKSLDTIGPALLALRLKNNQPPLANTAVTLEAVPAAPEPGRRVRFTADFALLGITQADGLELPVTLPADGSVVFRAIAIDRFGNEGPMAELAVVVQENQPPVVTFTRLNPVSGPVFSGNGFSVRVNVTDDGTVTDFRAAATGAAIVPLQTNATGNSIVVQGVVHASAIPGEKIILIAQATDNANRGTGEQRFELDVADGTAPAVAFVSPAANAVADPAQSFAVVIGTTDNSGDVTLEVTLSGSVTGTQSTVVDGTPNLASRRTLNFDLSSAPATGGTFTALARATDAAGRVGTASRTFALPDRRAPQLTTTVPAAGALQQSLWTDVVLTFDEPMNLATFTPTNIDFPGAFTVTPNGANTVLTLQAANALTPGQLQSVRLKPGLTDAAGNPWQDSGGATIPPEGKLLPFTTASLAATTPVPNARVVPGQTLTARADFQSGLGADQIVFQTLLGNVATQAVNPATSTTASGAVTISLAAVTTESLFIVARKTGRPAFTLPAIPLDVRPRSDDDDGDGISNGQEVDAGLDPFRDDRQDDNDGDGRNNAQEVLAGTDPNDPDSDDDGLNDGAESTAGTNPLLADTDSDGLKDGAEAALGANPLLADTDGDTLNDGLEVGVGRYQLISGSFTFDQAQADAVVRGGHLLTVTSAAEQSALATVLGSAPTSGWIGLSDRRIEGTFTWLTGEPSSFLRFGPGEPNNVGDEDGVQLRSDGLWNDASLSAQLPYVLEKGFFTNPASADSDGDGVRDEVDTFPGQQNRAPVAGNDSLPANPGVPTVIAASVLLGNDSDPDGDPFVITGVGTPANGTAVLGAGGTQVTYTPNPGSTGADSFSYTVTDAGGLTASATVTMSVGTNHPPVAGTLLSYDNRGLQFDGSDDAGAGATLPAITDTFTFELWVKPNRARGSTGEANSGASAQGLGEFAIFPTHGTNNLGGDPHAGAGLSVGTNGFVVVEHAGNYFPSPLVFNATVNDWTHVAVVYENNQPRLYVNGVLVRTGLVSPRTVHPSTELSTALGHYQGQMDEYRVWNFARSSADIAADFSRRLSGTEPGLAVYWRMDEGTGATLLSDEPAGRDGTLAGGTGRVTPGAPMATFGEHVSVIVDTTTPVVLAGSDQDGGAPSGRIRLLPQHGTLFQRAAGGGVGAQITSVPAVVSDGARRIFYQPAAAFVGEDSFTFSVHDGIAESAPALALVHVLPNFAPVADDVWDVSQGTTVTSSSGFLPNSAGNNMFGAANGVEPGNAIFADGHPAGFTHFVEWRTAGVIRLEGTRVSATQGGDPVGRRTFTEMRLFGRFDSASAFQLLATFQPGENPYFNNPLRTMLNFAPFLGQEFRAEFDQFGDFQFAGPRIEELDAIGETVVLVPVPAQVVLQNATSDQSQGGFTPAQLIDGIVVGGQHGWAGDVGGTPPMTAVFETAQDIGATAATEFVFGLPQPFGGAHFIGNFRLSATTDSRDQFADGLINGGDVTANWTVLEILEVTSTGGETLTVLADGSILVGGAMPATTAYTVRAKGITGGVSGFRLELLEHPSLPNNGPGRVGHGNWVLAEFTVEVSGAILVPNRAPHSEPDAAQTPQGFPVTTGNVLTNDTDPEGDPLVVFDFAQPPAGTGAVANNGDGTFTYTPPDGAFTGPATFTYRATDGHQPGTPATVTITVNPTPIVAWNNPAGGNWNTAANWTPTRVPGPNDVTVISLAGTYTVSLDIDPTVSQLVLGGASGTQTLSLNGRTLTVNNGGTGTGNGNLSIASGTSVIHGALSVGQLFLAATLTGTGDVTVTNALTWQSGTMADSGRTILPPGSSLDVITGNQKLLTNGRRLVVNTPVLWDEGALVLQNDATAGAGVDNNSTWTFAGEPDVVWSNFTSARPVSFINAGTLIKNGGGTADFGAPFTNAGNFSIESGTVRLLAGSSLSTGPIAVAAGAALQHHADFDYTGAATLTNAGTVRFLGGTQAFNGNYSATGATELSAGTVIFDAPITLPSLFLASVLAGAGDVTITGSLSWHAGAMTGSGKTILPPGSSLDVVTGNQKLLTNGRRLVVNTPVLWDEGALVLQNDATAGAGVDNNSTWTFTGEPDVAWSNFTSARPVSFINAGTLIKNGAGTADFSVPFSNAGNFSIENGTVRLLSASSGSTGPIAVAAGAALQHHADFDYTGAGTLSNAGTVRFLGGTQVFNGNYSATGATELSAGIVIFDAPITLPSLFLASVLAGAGDVTITGSLSWHAGAMSGSGKTILPPGSSLDVVTGNQKLLTNGRRLVVNTPVLWDEGALVLQNDATAGAGVDNNSTWTFAGEPDVVWSNFTSARPVSFINLGTLIKDGGGTTDFTVPFTNAGILEVETGAVRFLTANSGSTGAMQVAATGRLEFHSDFSYGPTSSFSGAGVIDWIGGTHSFDGARTIPNPAILRATLAGTGDVTFSNQLVWFSGTMTGTGKTIFPVGSVLDPQSGNQKLLTNGRRVVADTPVLWDEGNLVLQNDATAGAGVDNRSTWTFAGEPDLVWSNFTPARPVSFVNEAILIKNGGGTTDVSVPFTNAGTLQVEVGTLRCLDGNGGSTGAMHVAAAGRLEFHSNFSYSPTSSFSGAGVVDWVGGTHTFDSALTIPNPTILRTTLAGTGDVTFSNQLVWFSGTMTGTGKTIFPVGSVLDPQSGNQKLLTNGRRVVADTPVLWDEGNLVFQNDATAGAGVDNRSTWTFAGEPDLIWSNFTPARPVSFVNEAILIKNGGGTTDFSVPFTNTGELEVETGTLNIVTAPTLAGAVTVSIGASLSGAVPLSFTSGTVSGNGTIAANVSNAGATFAVGSGTEKLTITGSYAQQAGGTLRTRLSAAPAAGTPNRQVALAVSGQATFGGTLDVVLAFPFDEALDSNFPIVTYGSQTGDFATASGLIANFGYDFTRASTPASLNLTATTKGEVPLSPGAALAPMDFAQWMETMRDARTNGLGPQEDPDGDGMTNFQEYVFGTRPFTPQPAGPVKVDVLPGANGPQVFVTFRQRTNAPGLQHIVEISSDGHTWVSDQASPDLRSIQQIGDGADFILETHVYQFTQLSSRQHFFRVHEAVEALRAKPLLIRRGEKRR